MRQKRAGGFTPSFGKKKWLPVAIKLAIAAVTSCYLVFIVFFSTRTGTEHASHEGIGEQALIASSMVAVPQKKVIAYVISVTSDGPYMDGAAVLAHGIRKASQKSKYGYDLLAFVYPQVSTSRKPLERAGWKLLDKDLPLRVSDIEGAYLRERIEKNGCCGATELLKLYSWTLEDYHRVVHLDMDSLVLDQMDELYDMDKHLIYTCDYGMMTKGSVACPVQGGFIVVKPSMEEYQGLVNTVLKGDFRDGSGWGGENIGWFWGGMTIQGLLPYYFTKIIAPEFASEVDRCVYNNMFDNPGCRNMSEPLVKNVHFTVCQKPWSCFVHEKNVRCNDFLKKWHELRHELEVLETGKTGESCDRHGHYHPMTFLQEGNGVGEGEADKLTAPG